MPLVGSAVTVEAILSTPTSRQPLGRAAAGTPVDWAVARGERSAPACRPSILAGGLTPENVGEAIRTVRPYAVDVSSGVESSRGVKDPGLIRRVLRGREADHAEADGRGSVDALDLPRVMKRVLSGSNPPANCTWATMPGRSSSFSICNTTTRCSCSSRRTTR